MPHNARSDNPCGLPESRQGSVGYWPPGTHVVVRNLDSWADGQPGIVVGYLGDWVPPRVTVQLDTIRYLAFDDELKTRGPRLRGEPYREADRRA